MEVVFAVCALLVVLNGLSLAILAKLPSNAAGAVWFAILMGTLLSIDVVIATLVMPSMMV